MDVGYQCFGGPCCLHLQNLHRIENLKYHINILLIHAVLIFLLLSILAFIAFCREFMTQMERDGKLLFSYLGLLGQF
jgi:hypothetical protein